MIHLIFVPSSAQGREADTLTVTHGAVNGMRSQEPFGNGEFIGPQLDEIIGVSPVALDGKCDAGQPRGISGMGSAPLQHEKDSFISASSRVVVFQFRIVISLYSGFAAIREKRLCVSRAARRRK